MMDVLQKPVYELDLSVRAHRCLAEAGIETVADLVRRSNEDLLRIPTFGKKSAKEVRDVLTDFGLSLKENEPRCISPRRFSAAISVATLEETIKPIIGYDSWGYERMVRDILNLYPETPVALRFGVTKQTLAYAAHDLLFGVLSDYANTRGPGRPSERTARIFSLRYGLTGGGTNTLRDIAAACGCCAERVRQILAKGLARMRDPSRTKLILACLAAQQEGWTP